MLRPTLLLAALALASPVLAQGQGNPGAGGGGGGNAPTDCRVRINATPAGSWMIQGLDPFDGAIPEATFGVTFTNEGSGQCRFTPIFQLDQPPFGLSRGTGKSIAYALLNMTDSQDVTPRAGRSQRTLSQGLLVLAPSESTTVLYKLVADPDEVRDAGTFTEDVTLEAQDESFRSVGGARLVLGINVLPSARIGLAGAYAIHDGKAVVNLGELRQGPAPVPLQLRVNATGRYDLHVISANAGRLRLGSTEWNVPYSISIGGNSVNLAGAGTLSGATSDGFQRDSLPIHFTVGDVSGKRAGVYSDVLSISVTAR
jgi:hypothetical protein